jgi:hypothetical protein
MQTGASTAHGKYQPDNMLCNVMFATYGSIEYAIQVTELMYGFIVLLTRRCNNQASLVWHKVKEGRSFDHVIFAE